MDLLAILTLAGMPAEWGPVVGLCVVGAASVLAAVLPQPEPGSRWEKARRLLDFLAMNLGRASNRTAADRLAVALVAAGAALPGTVRPEPETAPAYTDLASALLGGLKR